MLDVWLGSECEKVESQKVVKNVANTLKPWNFFNFKLCLSKLKSKTYKKKHMLPSHSKPWSENCYKPSCII